MKKEYKKPAAVKVEFNYEDVVATSGSCRWRVMVTDGFISCHDVEEGEGSWYGDQA